MDAITNDIALNASKALRGHFPKAWRRAMRTLADKIALQARLGGAEDDLADDHLPFATGDRPEDINAIAARLADAQEELAAAREEVSAVTARAVTAEALGQQLEKVDADRRARSLLRRLVIACRGG